MGEVSQARYVEATADERLEALEQLAALLAATHAELLDVLAAADACGDWELDGAVAPAPWLVARLGLARRSADEWVRVAAALQELPALRGSYASGALSWDQVRPATRFVTPADDAAQAERLPGFSAAQIALMARQARPITDDEALDAQAARSLTFTRDHRRGGMVLRGFLPYEQAEAVRLALDAVAESCGPDQRLGIWSPIAVRRADALHELALQGLGSAPVPHRATVVLHADAAVVDGTRPGNGLLGDLAVCARGVLRALCDARVEVALHGPDGATVGVARASRRIPAWLHRQVAHRDGTCRWPGCERAIRQVHHVEHWAAGGPTDLRNLVGLCWTHHVLLHEGGWRLEGDPDHNLTFVSPLGRCLTSRPRPLRPEVRARLRRPGVGQSGEGQSGDPP